MDKAKEGNFIKEKKEYLLSRMTTREGWVDVLIGSAIYGFVIVEYKDAIFDTIYNFFITSLGVEQLSLYLSFLIFGVFLSFLGLAISVVINWIYHKVKK